MCDHVQGISQEQTVVNRKALITRHPGVKIQKPKAWAEGGGEGRGS